MRNRTVVALGAIAFSLCVVSPVAGQDTFTSTSRVQLGPNLVENGGFELPEVALGEVFYEGNFMGGWRIARGSVDLLDVDYWPAGAGEQSIDLAGFTDGVIAQRVPTEPGRNYILAFQLATNVNKIDCPEPVKTVTLRFSGREVARINVSYEGRDADNMGWTLTELRVVATRSSSRLVFRSSTQDSPCGPTLDSISLREVLASGSGAGS